MKKSLILLLFTSIACSLAGQPLTQTIRGLVTDQISRTPLPGATLTIQDSNPLVGTATGPDGTFRLDKVPVGTYTLVVSFVGYLPRIVAGVIVNSGKETVINISLEEDALRMQEVVITAGIDKSKPLNDATLVSGRTFSVEETRKFAAAVNDPARMAVSFAGVVGGADDSNYLSVRGNSPFGLLWRIEGVDIPNPNHFADVATSGGGISILSTQLLANSDFLNGAFPAEYGNALAGVFDLKFRRGNNEQREYTLQAGFLGMDVAAEGPITKGTGGSYLVNYRYSTLSILSEFGFNVGDAVTNFQDLSFSVAVPAGRSGVFGVFGFGGLSNQKAEAVRDSAVWEDESAGYDWTYFSNTGAFGFKHAISLSDKTFLQSGLVLSGNEYGFRNERLDSLYQPEMDFEERYTNTKLTLSSTVDHKLSSRSSLRSGAYFNVYGFSLRQEEFDMGIPDEQALNTESNTSSVQVFTQWMFKATPRWQTNMGIHGLLLTANGTYSVEPRLSTLYALSPKSSLTLGYGLHSQLQSVGTYEAQLLTDEGQYVYPNRELRPNKAHHAVIGYSHAFTPRLHLKTEAYYQRLFNIAVSRDVQSTLSTLNRVGGYVTDPLVNKGKGRNVGLELTVEQFMDHNLYFMLSSSLYDSRYQALDGVWRNTRFNGNFASSFTGGKEFSLKRDRMLGLNLRMFYHGGLRETPLDEELSQQQGEAVYLNHLAYSEELPDYFRTDLRLSLKRNRQKSTSVVALDIQNVTNRQNLGGTYFDPLTGTSKKWYQMSLLPILSYRIEF